MATVRLAELAMARSGDKGASANVGIIATSEEIYRLLERELTAERVATFFGPLGVERVTRFEIPNLWAFNFLLKNILAGGGSRSLRIDAQGKVLGQALLEIPIDVPDDLLMGSASTAGAGKQ